MTQSQPYIEKESEAPLQPEGRNVKVTLPEGHYRIASATPTEPCPAGQINQKSETYLEVPQYNPMGIIVPLACLGGISAGRGAAFALLSGFSAVGWNGWATLAELARRSGLQLARAESQKPEFPTSDRLRFGVSLNRMHHIFCFKSGS